MEHTPLTLIARNDESFSFLYQEVIDSFPQVRFFDPETEVPCLDGVSLLYLPGGYPEKHLEALVANSAARQAIRDFAERGGRIQAECGGMMYLCQSIVTDTGEYPMCGVLPYRITARLSDRRLSLGYRRFVLHGHEYRGHEFHYTRFLDPQPVSVTQVYDAKGNPVPTPVLLYKNVLASYTHLYTPSAWSPSVPVASVASSVAPSVVATSVSGSCVSRCHRDHHCDHHSLLRPLMFVGTGSDVGKSVIAAAFCRIFLQDGYHPAPFKAQNMSLNSYATPEGLEIGRAQAVQAEAAGIPCHTDMNPILLKPQSDHTSQVVLNGRPAGNQSAGSYFRREGREPLRQAAYKAFDRLTAKYNPIVLEGAGSISELNLRDVDLVNMPMALHAGAAVILVADIDRGGVFASVYGSIMLLSEEERSHVKGIIINKFRGDLSLFDKGRTILEDICHVPVLGVVPYFTDIHIEEEDSMSLAKKSFQQAPGAAQVTVAVVMLRHVSNFTDFDSLERDPRVHLFYTSNPADLAEADIIILPGTKSTIDDLYYLRRNGLAEAVVHARRRGATVLGICGGYQMMGREVCDPDHVEGDQERMPGLGLLPVTTTMSGEKRTRQVHGQSSVPDAPFSIAGYEIHMGTTTPLEQPAPLLHLDEGRDDGFWVDAHCMGTYVHGILDNQSFIDYLLAPFANKLQHPDSFDYDSYKQQQYDLLAHHVRRFVDISAVYRILKG